MADRPTCKHTYKLAGATIALAHDLLECLASGAREAIRAATRARCQAGRLMVAIRTGDPSDTLRRYEADLVDWEADYG